MGRAPRARPQRENNDLGVGPAGRPGAIPRTPGRAYGGDAEFRWNQEAPRESGGQQRRSQGTAPGLQARPTGRPVTVLTDSDILIEVSRGRDKAIVSQWLALGQSDALIVFSAVSAAELWAGARLSEYAALEALFDALICVPIDTAVGRRAGEYLRRYRKSHGVESSDALIAASAVGSGARLWTRNRKHYPMPEVAFYE